MNYSRYLYYKTLMEEVTSFLDTMPPQTSTKLFRQHLGELQLEIRQKREQVLSMQSQGSWGVSVGDKAFLQYLSATESLINPVLGKLWLRKSYIHWIRSQFIELLESLKNHPEPKLKAVFLAQETSIWPSLESVYQAFVADPACEAQIVYLPFEHPNDDKTVDSFEIYKGMGYPIKHCLSYDLSQESPDVAFYPKPYSSVVEKFNIDHVRQVVERCVYIPYWVNWMALQNIPFLIDYHYRAPFFQQVWKIFDAPNYVIGAHENYGPTRGRNVELIGHPRFDSIDKLEKIREKIPDDWKRKIANKIVVMWNVHSFIATSNEENWSTFKTLGRQILDYFQNNKQFVLLWRPHPHFFKSHTNNGVMSPQEMEDLIVSVSNSSNAILDTTPDYLSAFSIADALISDASSLLVEFLLTGRPVMYTYNEASYSIVNENLLPALYTAGAWQNVENFLQILIDGQDYKREERVNVTKMFMPNAGNHVGELVKVKCIQDLEAEEIRCAKVISQNYKHHFSSGRI